MASHSHPEVCNAPRPSTRLALAARAALAVSACQDQPIDVPLTIAVSSPRHSGHRRAAARRRPRSSTARSLGSAGSSWMPAASRRSTSPRREPRAGRARVRRDTWPGVACPRLRSTFEKRGMLGSSSSAGGRGNEWCLLGEPHGLRRQRRDDEPRAIVVDNIGTTGQVRAAVARLGVPDDAVID